MKNLKRIGLFVAAGLLLILLGAGWRVHSISGTVRSEDGVPLRQAIVRLKGTPLSVRTDADGRFRLEGFAPAFRLRVTAWKDGFYIAGTNVWPWDQQVEIRIAAYATQDDTGYEWVAPEIQDRTRIQATAIQFGLDLTSKMSFNHAFLPLSESLTLGCRDCHGETIFDQWASSTHALGTANQRFLSMYNGSDVFGNQSPTTRLAASRDYGFIRLPPDPEMPYFGPGYKLDFPDTAGNCSTCHLPGAALEAPYSVDPNFVTGVDANGTHCDFCHKIAGVRLNPETGLPFENMPGILSLELLRPGAQQQIFFGPFDDVDIGPDSYLPLMAESQICAPCHSTSFWGVPVYTSYNEWLASSYADPQNGQTCQDCHMASSGQQSNFAPGRGGQERDPDTIPSHGFPGASDEKLLQQAVHLEMESERGNGKVTVRVTITNQRSGHHIPTGSPLRHMILLVRAWGPDRSPLKQIEGSVLPEWAGRGDPAGGYFAGMPGTIYARVLSELWTDISPTAAYWNPTRIVSDNRIPALDSDMTIYTFALQEAEPVEIEVQLFFRQAFINLADLKGWEVQDILMGSANMSLP